MTEVTILAYLQSTPGHSAAEIAKEFTKNGTKILRSEVNQILYKLDKKKLCTHTEDQPPRWSITGLEPTENQRFSPTNTEVSSIAVPALQTIPGACKMCGCIAACGRGAAEAKAAAVTDAKLAVEELTKLAVAELTEAAPVEAKPVEEKPIEVKSTTIKRAPRAKKTEATSAADAE